jgi:hypothetical protein
MTCCLWRRFLRAWLLPLRLQASAAQYAAELDELYDSAPDKP